jgi:hypothetical protein
MPSSIPCQDNSLYLEGSEKCVVILEYPHCHTICVQHIPQVQLDSIAHQQNHHHCHDSQSLILMDPQY